MSNIGSGFTASTCQDVCTRTPGCMSVDLRTDDKCWLGSQDNMPLKAEASSDNYLFIVECGQILKTIYFIGVESCFKTILLLVLCHNDQTFICILHISIVIASGLIIYLPDILNVIHIFWLILPAFII